MKAQLETLQNRLDRPVAPYSLALFRILFGLLMFWEVLRYFLGGWIGRFYLEPVFLFKYYGFEWVQPWPGDGLYWHFGLLGLLSLLITFGLFYRLAIWSFLLGFSYIFLLDQARYLNHFYLVILVNFLLCLTPAHHAWSLDARRLGQPRDVPRWAVWSLMALFEIVLLYAGIVKINPDWLAGQPLNMWFSDRSQTPLIGPLIEGDWAIYAAAYGVIALHLLGAPLLLWRRTRLFVFVVYCAFHITNAVVFHIGIFPWLTIAGTLMFFAPDWPVRLARRLRPQAAEQLRAAPSRTPAIIYAVLAVFLFLQIFVPLRHYLYPGDVAWTEEGHRFAWRMKLRSKQGVAKFYITDHENGRLWTVKPREYLSSRQSRYLNGRPDMILQFAHFLEQQYRQEYELDKVEVRVSVWCSLNGQTPHLLIDPAIDLTKIERRLWPPADWILPRY